MEFKWKILQEAQIVGLPFFSCHQFWSLVLSFPSPGCFHSLFQVAKNHADVMFPNNNNEPIEACTLCPSICGIRYIERTDLIAA